MLPQSCPPKADTHHSREKPLQVLQQLSVLSLPLKLPLVHADQIQLLLELLQSVGEVVVLEIGALHLVLEGLKVLPLLLQVLSV